MTHPIVFTGMWATTFYFGNFVGPTLGGIISEHLGFQNMTLFYFGSLCITFIMDIIEFIFTIKTEGYNDMK